jgi:hypothetical protein
MSTILRENKIWSFVITIVVVPSTYPIALDLHDVKKAKAQRLILDGVKDHLIPHLAEKKTTKEMWDAFKRRRNRRGLIQLLQQLWSTFRPSLIRTFLWLL